MSKSGFFLFFLVIIFAACGPKIIENIDQKYSPLDYSTEVKVFKLNAVPNENSKYIGSDKKSLMLGVVIDLD